MFNKNAYGSVADSLKTSNWNPKWGGYEVSGQSGHPDPDRRLVQEPDTLTTLPWQQWFGQLQSWRQQARIQQADNRMEMAIDEDFYDSIQMDMNDIAVLMERRQPIMTFNFIKDSLNTLMGIEKRARFDYSVKPRNRGDERTAKLKTKVLKYDSDINHAGYVRSQVFASSLKAGVGWFDIRARNTPDSPIHYGSEKWRNVWFDHLAVSLTRREARFVCREKWVDLDIACALFKQHAEDLKSMSAHVNAIYPYNPDDIVLSDPASEFDVEGQLDSIFSPRGETLRDRVKLCEMWYRIPGQVDILRMADKDTPWGCLDGTIYRKGDPDQDYLVKGRYFSTQKVFKMIVRCAYWCGAVYLKDMLSPYRHWEFPLVPMWCYIRERDNMPYGVIRDLRDPQIDINKRRSKALWLLSANQIIAEKGAVDDKLEAVTESQRADGYMEVTPGKRFELVRNLELAASHIEMAHDSERMIRSISGRIDPQLVETQKEISGKAANILREGTQVASGVMFDNYYFAGQLVGEIQLALTEQFRDEDDEILISGDTQKEEFTPINRVQEDGTILNPITKAQGRFIVGKQDFRESVRMAMFQSLFDLVNNLSRNPAMAQTALALLDLAVDLMDDLPNKDAIVERIRKINKQHAPDENLTDEERQKVRQQEDHEKQMKALMEQLQIGMLQAKLRAANVKADSDEAKAIKAHVDATVKELEGYLKALEVAGSIQINPAIVGAADELVAEAKKLGGTDILAPNAAGANGQNGRQLGPAAQSQGGM